LGTRRTLSKKGALGHFKKEKGPSDASNRSEKWVLAASATISTTGGRTDKGDLMDGKDGPKDSVSSLLSKRRGFARRGRRRKGRIVGEKKVYVNGRRLN